VLLAAGEVVGYDRLLLATGSAPRHLDVPGAHADHVVVLRTLPDSDRLRGVLAAGGPLAIVGAGWIGLEVAAAARAAGVDVTVVESAELPLLRVLGPSVAGVFADLHRARGVDLRLGSGVAEILDDAVVLADGDRVPAATVLLGVGVTPVTHLAEQAGLHVDDGVVVDEALRTSVPDVYAAGDVARAYHPRYRRHLRTEHWANALNGGPAAARSMLDQPVVYDRLPYFFTDQYELGMEYVGWADAAAADVVLRGDPGGEGAGLQFAAFWLVDGVVEAAMHVNQWDDGVEPLRAVVGLQRPVDPARLADPSVPLVDL
jgi:3-phenylpropionate/trans-cinnamate dioxygenase ferredoxin reductase subunit